MNRPGFKSFTAVLLLSLYFLGSIPYELIHQFRHLYEYSLLHSELNEQNPCHRNIFHKDLKVGCKHKEHISNSQNECPECEKAFFHEQILGIKCTYLCSVEISSETHFPINILSSGRKLHVKPRGPPTHQV